MNSDGKFGERLTLALEVKGKKSGAWLGREIGVASSTVNDWRRGESEPTLSNLIAAAAVLGVTVQWLAVGEGTPWGEEGATPPPFIPPRQAVEPRLDKWLFSRVIDGIRRTYSKVGGKLQTINEVELGLEMYHRIAAIAETEEARRGALLMALDQLERDLLEKTKRPASGKQSA